MYKFTKIDCCVSFDTRDELEDALMGFKLLCTVEFQGAGVYHLIIHFDEIKRCVRVPDTFYTCKEFSDICSEYIRIDNSEIRNKAQKVIDVLQKREPENPEELSFEEHMTKYAGANWKEEFDAYTNMEKELARIARKLYNQDGDKNEN